LKNSERVTPVAAVVSAVLSMACCLPFALPVALGVAGLSVMLDTLRPWLIAASLVLLGVGFVQLYRKRACGRRSRGSLVLLGIATVIVLSFAFLPQAVATLIAGSR
jgi:ABC-type Fe3+ transport system permease subunit